MKTFKLLVHQKTFSEDEVIIYSKDYPGLNVGDVIEVYSPDDEFSRLLLQVNAFPDERENQPKDKPSISIEQSITSTFQLRLYGDVIVNKVDASSVVLDSVELIFKDQYLSRSDMWRTRNLLKNSIVFLNKKFEKHIRFQVFEMWSGGEKVASGYINDSTKIVFRSASSMVYLFIQMSSEMWDFDVNGDLYFEKAVNGFLSDLFEKWKLSSCNHDVTIVLFSRTYYEANSIEDFPEEMRDCLQQDYKGKFYEDFYRVAIQNERYDEWNTIFYEDISKGSHKTPSISISKWDSTVNPRSTKETFESKKETSDVDVTNIIILLKKLFNNYEKEVLRIHEKYSKKIPKAFNSTASQGNFLEVLNMALNVFEKHYLDRSFDRTGQLSVVISPGVGVFEVDKDLTNITKQRIIDNGIGSDLVCLGEQPLHAVPLFKFNMKQNEIDLISNQFNTVDNSTRTYNMPHWINLSFYTSKRQSRYSTFIPRIKMPNVSENNNTNNTSITTTITTLNSSSSEKFLKSTDCYPLTPPPIAQKRSFDNLEAEYDKYDAEVFYSSYNQIENEKLTSSSITVRNRKKSAAISSPFSVNSNKRIDELDCTGNMLRTKEESNSNLAMNKRTKSINPFNPKQIQLKLTSNRRRWTHVFPPSGQNGIFMPSGMQQHHYRTIPQNIACTLLPISNSPNDLRKISSSFNLNNTNSLNIESLSLLNAVNFNQTDELDTITDMNQMATPDQLTLYNYKRTSFSEKFKNSKNSCNDDANFLFTTGVTTTTDWKSLTISACLPLTTDFLPDPKSMEQDYLDSEYMLIPEIQSADDRRCYRDEDHHNHNALKTDQVFQELICQRLQQGFQVVLNPNFQILQLQSSTPLQANTPNMSKTDNLELKAKKLNSTDLSDRYCVMSIGRIFHRLELDNSTNDNSVVKIKISRPKDLMLNNNIKIHYCYRFRAPDSEQYIVSWVDFVTESLENYNWSYLDNYICLRGSEDEYELRENLKFWRLRMLLLPSMQQQTKQILDNISTSGFNCDIYSRISQQDSNKLIKGFLKFFSIINRIKNQTKSGTSSNNPTVSFEPGPRRFSATFANSLNRNNSVDATTFRERINSVNYEKSTKRLGLLFDKQFANDDLIETEFRNSVENLDNLENNVKKLNGTNLASIIDAMKAQFNRFQFLPKQANLPSYLFTSADAVQWAMQSIENITNEERAVNLFTKLLENRSICHASGQQDYPFKYGFFLYYIVVKNQKLADDRVDLEMYKREWFEVEISNSSIISSQQAAAAAQANEQPPKKLVGLKNPLPKFFSPNLGNQNSHKKMEPNANNKQTTKGTNYYKSVLDTDFGSNSKSKSNRAEWLHIKYQQTYNPVQAFELVLEWMVSTGNQIAEIVQNWARRSTGLTGLHLVPIPSDPFALPFYSKSDPLRAPIYVAINFDCLNAELSNQLLTNEAKLFKFREEILCRFGFLPFLGGIKKDQKQYVHVSGSIFVLIPNNEKAADKKTDKSNETKEEEHEQIYLTRHFSGSKQNKKGLEKIRTGFHWSWNYMISKRWKNAITGDEMFQRRVLKDFRLFCANDNDRLVRFASEIESILN